MNIKTFLLTLSFLALQKAQAQDSIPIPEFSRKVMYLKKNNTLSDLDRSDLSRIQKDKLMPKVVKLASGYKFYIKAEGCCARVTHSGKSTERFIVRIEPGIDPSEVIQLYKFESKKDTRILLTTKVTLGSALNDNSAKLSTFPLQFKTISPGVYIITHEDQLDDGEYVFICGQEAGGTGRSTSAITNNTFEKGYCFGVYNKESE
jgi:hypothetical protein